MAIKDKLTEEFLQALKEVEGVLSKMLFMKHSFFEKGFAYYIQFKRDRTIVEFIFGAPEFQVEIIIYTSKGEFAFKDLLEIPSISNWVENNRYVQKDGRNVKNELLWGIELMKVSLTKVE